MKVYIDKETDTAFDFDDAEQVIREAVACVEKDKKLPEELEVNVLLLSPEEVRSINLETRNVDATTDVLSFPYFEFEVPGCFDGTIYEEEENILGDIVINAEQVIAQAQEYGHSQRRELAFLVVHSLLHLIGYDHMEEADGELMRAEEKRMMERLGITRN